MKRPSFHLASEADAAPGSVAQRIRSLQAEARLLAREHAHALAAAMSSVAQLASDIADGGEAYHPGVAAVARQIAAETERSLTTLESILVKSL